jgi:hypothetical protein
MTRDTRLPALRGPTPVAVHDDRHVTRQSIPGYRGEQRFFSCPFLNYAGEIRKHKE